MKKFYILTILFCCTIASSHPGQKNIKALLYGTWGLAESDTRETNGVLGKTIVFDDTINFTSITDNNRFNYEYYTTGSLVYIVAFNTFYTTSYISIKSIDEHTCAFLYNGKMYNYKKHEKTGKQNTITVRIIQDNQAVPVINNTVTLKNKPFSFQFISAQPPNLLIHASFKNNIYKLAANKTLKPHEHGLVFSGMAETVKNTNRELFIRDNASSYWYYTSFRDHRYDQVTIERDRMTCTRTIHQTYIFPDKRRILVSALQQKTIYLVFVSNQYDRQTKKSTYSLVASLKLIFK